MSFTECDLNILLLNEWMFDHMNNSIGAHHVRAIDVDFLVVPYYRIACAEEKKSRKRRKLLSSRSRVREGRGFWTKSNKVKLFLFSFSFSELYIDIYATNCRCVGILHFIIIIVLLRSRRLLPSTAIHGPKRDNEYESFFPR